MQGIFGQLFAFEKPEAEQPSKGEATYDTKHPQPPGNLAEQDGAQASRDSG
jgi:hypothetical protein